MIWSEWWLNPPLALSVALAVGYGSLFHLWQGRSYKDLIVYAAAAGIGFALGQGLGMLLNFQWLQIGQVHVAEATLVAWFALLVARSKPDPSPVRRTRRSNRRTHGSLS